MIPIYGIIKTDGEGLEPVCLLWHTFGHTQANRSSALTFLYEFDKHICSWATAAVLRFILPKFLLE